MFKGVPPRLRGHPNVCGGLKHFVISQEEMWQNPPIAKVTSVAIQMGSTHCPRNSESAGKRKERPQGAP